MNEEEYYPGKGCQCHAHSDWECCCNVDWTEPEVYELRDEVKELKKWKEAIIEKLITWHIYSEEHENNPKKALHDLAVINSDVAVYFHEQEKWHKKLKHKILDIWYSSPIAYKLWKLCGSKQPPF
jgi:hypothetical protein